MIYQTLYYFNVNHFKSKHSCFFTIQIFIKDMLFDMLLVKSYFQF